MHITTLPLDNINIASVDRLASPKTLHAEIPHTPCSVRTVMHGRDAVASILDGADKRLLVIVGPCSVHNIDDAKEYAVRLQKIAESVADTLCIVMRVYFEKPRSVLGWKGFINDPGLDNTFRMEDGLRRARELLRFIAELGLPAATEYLDSLTPQYIGDFISWAAIGARTAESQPHREMASGISTPIGFKNATDGSLAAAVNGILFAREPHRFLGVTEDGLPAMFRTTGNPYAHIVLRGGKQPNYDARSIAACENALAVAGIRQRIIVDCSHGNSRKNHEKQKDVVDNILAQITHGNTSVCGIMLESNLCAGRQEIPEDPATLARGVSVTDACIGWDETESLLLRIASAHG